MIATGTANALSKRRTDIPPLTPKAAGGGRAAAGTTVRPDPRQCIEFLEAARGRMAALCRGLAHRLTVADGPRPPVFDEQGESPASACRRLDTYTVAAPPPVRVAPMPQRMDTFTVHPAGAAPSPAAHGPAKPEDPAGATGTLLSDTVVLTPRTGTGTPATETPPDREPGAFSDGNTAGPASRLPVKAATLPGDGKTDSAAAREHSVALEQAAASLEKRFAALKDNFMYLGVLKSLPLPEAMGLFDARWSGIENLAARAWQRLDYPDREGLFNLLSEEYSRIETLIHANDALNPIYSGLQGVYSDLQRMRDAGVDLDQGRRLMRRTGMGSP